MTERAKNSSDELAFRSDDSTPLSRVSSRFSRRSRCAPSREKEECDTGRGKSSGQERPGSYHGALSGASDSDATRDAARAHRVHRRRVSVRGRARIRLNIVNRAGTRCRRRFRENVYNRLAETCIIRCNCELQATQQTGKGTAGETQYS